MDIYKANKHLNKENATVVTPIKLDTPEAREVDRAAEREFYRLVASHRKMNQSQDAQLTADETRAVDIARRHKWAISMMQKFGLAEWLKTMTGDD